jgi:hypothetical protein
MNGKYDARMKKFHKKFSIILKIDFFPILLPKKIFHKN